MQIIMIAFKQNPEGTAMSKKTLSAFGSCQSVPNGLVQMQVIPD